MVECGLIRDELNQKNRQTHSLVVNNDNELSLLIQKLDKFEKAYFSLIDKLKERFEDPESKGKPFQKYGALEDILSIYQFILGAYSMQGIYIWPRRISDANPFRSYMLYYLRGCLIWSHSCQEGPALFLNSMIL